jgi:serine/threonine protein kinase
VAQPQADQIDPAAVSGQGSAAAGALRPEPRLPAVFGRYLLLQRLSRGGMGEIFLAKHGLAGFEKLAVIKKVLPHLAEDSQFISRFVDEAQVAIKLAHVNIAQVFEVGRVGDAYFLALEYVEGRDLRRTLTLLAQNQSRFPLDIALLIGRELANGLAYAHRRTAADGSSLGLVHCDISPPNVMVSFEGEVKIIDFGIARSALRGTATDPKMGFGKFGYMAPEQLIRGGVVDHRTDVYAAGVVLFELLTGTRLYEPKEFTDYRALARAVAQGQHRVPSDVDRSLAACDSLIKRALSPRPDDRFASAAELRDAIALLLASVNPTISTDRLSAVMRGLFATEMVQQRELQERIANTHLADFHEQLNTQVVPTVSFALSEPLSDPSAPVVGKVAAKRPEPVAPSRAGERQSRRTAPPPEPVVPAAAPRSRPSAAAPSSVSAARAPEPPPRSRANLVVTATSIAVLVGALVFVVIRKYVVTPPPAKLVPTVQPIEDEPRPKIPTIRRPVTRDTVELQYRELSREYDAFRADKGPVLEREWAEVTAAARSGDNLSDAVRKLEAFQARLRALRR